MVAAKAVVIDSNVFVIDLRYPRDRYFRRNRAFLDHIARVGSGVTTLINLLEVCGILSFSLTPDQFWELYHYLPQRYRIHVVPTAALDMPIPPVKIGSVLDLMAMRLSFGDALVLATLEAYVPQASCFVSWDAAHFNGKARIPVLTPDQFLRQ